MAKKKRGGHEEHENHERWLVSYADFITLLFAFFVVMYAVSRVDNVRLAQASESIKFAMHFEGSGGVGKLPIFAGPPSEGGCAANVGPSKVSRPEVKKELENLKKKFEAKLQSYLIKHETPHIQVVAEPGKLSIRLGAARFFDPASAALRPDAVPVLDAIAEELVSTGRPVRVEAHTDSMPVGGNRFRDNWELSASRAARVASFLEDAHGVPEKHLTAAGLAASRPLVANDTEAGRELNRRLELVIEWPEDAPPVRR